MGGSPPLPKAIKRLRGTYTNHRDSKGQPEPEPGIPVVPSHLSANAKLIWNQTAQLLDSMNCLVLADVFALEGFAKVAAEKKVIEDLIAKQGYYIDTDKGQILNPLIKVDSDLDKRYLAYLGRLGLTPSDRTRLVVNPTAKEKNQFSEF